MSTSASTLAIGGGPSPSRGGTSLALIFPWCVLCRQLLVISVVALRIRVRVRVRVRVGS